MRRTDRRVAVSHSSSSGQREAVKSVCVACGARTLIKLPPHRQPQARVGALVQCRACGLIAPDANEPKVRSGFADDYEPLESFKAQIMGDEILDAFTHEHVRRQLQSALEYAQGDVALICHRYLPVALDAFAHVVGKYGFTESVEGVMESVRVMATLAKDDEHVVQRLVRIRKALTPTGEWVREDAAADQEDARKTQLELDAARREQEEVRRAEQLALENARRAKLRARKVALGLDPSVPRLPLVLETPLGVFVTHSGRSVRLRANVRFAKSFQWFVDGKPVEDDEEFVRGARGSSLLLRRLSKRVEGEYHCVCENEEGAASTRGCRVSIVALRSRRLLSRKLRGLASSPIAPVGWKSATVFCVANSVQLFHAATLATVKLLPALPSASHQTLAWNSQTKLLASASSVAGRRQELSVYALDFTSVDSGSFSDSVGVGGTGAVSPKSKSRLLATSSLSSSSSKTLGAAAGSSGSAISRLLETHRITELSEVHAAQFFASGRLLLLSDMKHRAVVYELGSSLACLEVLEFGDRICHVASCLYESTVAIALRGRPLLQLYHPSRSSNTTSNPGSSSSSRSAAANTVFELEQLSFRFPVTCSAFDDRGFYLAVAEAKCLKAWISVLNVRVRREPRLPSKKRFEAHVGKVSALQWTSAASPLLLSSGFDGYVRVWDIEAAACMLAIHLDYGGIYAFALVDRVGSSSSYSAASSSISNNNSSTSAATDTANESNESVADDPVLLALGYTECRLQTRAMVQLRELEVSRRIEMDALAATIQKRWKGLQTRELVQKFIRAK